MAQRKPRPRKGAKPKAAPRRRIGPLWWGAGLLAIGWIAFDANRESVERHVPQLASLRMPWDKGETATGRREPPPAPAASARPERALKAARSDDPRPAAARASSASPVPTVLPEARPARPASAPPAPGPDAPAAKRPALAIPATVAQAAQTAPESFVTRSPTPLRRAPSSRSPAWMVLETGRPLRVTRREGGFARVESGIFTGWVEAAVVPEPAARPVPRVAASAPGTAAPAPVPHSIMPTLAAAEPRRAGPVPTAIVPSAGR